MNTQTIHSQVFWDMISTITKARMKDVGLDDAAYVTWDKESLFSEIDASPRIELSGVLIFRPPNFDFFSVLNDPLSFDCELISIPMGFDIHIKVSYKLMAEFLYSIDAFDELGKYTSSEDKEKVVTLSIGAYGGALAAYLLAARNGV